MRYAKPALSLADQLARLRARGLIVTDEQAALRWLQHVNYYRLRGYWLPLEANYAPGVEHRFRAGATFEQVAERYTFDRQLRLLVLDAIERIEVSMRACWAHALAMRYGAHAHENAAHFWNAAKHERCRSDLADELKRSKETFVRHYFDTYDDPPNPPIWAACEVMTLGQLSKWIDNLRLRHDRQAVAAPYGLDEQVVCSFAHHLSYIRNLCAHHARLYNRAFTLTFKLPARPQRLAASMNTASPRKVHNTLAAMQYLLDIVSPGHSWTTRLVQLLDQHPSVGPAEMGFPRDWRDRPVWRSGIAAQAAERP